MTWTFKDIPALAGKVFIVTGGNAGLGKVTARELAKKGAHVIIGGRSAEKTLPVIDEIKAESKNDNVEFIQMDLLSLKSVSEFADKFKAKGLPLHGLILNAGIMACPFSLSKDGIESQFATNHMAHFHLTNQLLPILERSAPSRVVSLSSSLHKSAPQPDGIRFDKINDEASYNEWTAYGQSKLANILFAKELNRRLQERGVNNVYVNAVHPGVIRTELVRHQEKKVPSFILSIYYSLGPFMGILSPDEGAATQLYLATSPDVEKENIRGEFYIPIAKKAQPTIKQGTDMALAKKLWEFSEELVKEKLGA
ncbi:hypothetical protein HDU96_001598 [Phlyctochytrium bullatum]|nr:hypothetical protein HDU96_001598 [Phlyctochytrium bullatum]